MRPANQFARLARTWEGRVLVLFGDKCADGGSPSELIMLLAATGSELILELEGPDAEQWAESLGNIISGHQFSHAPSQSKTS